MLDKIVNIVKNNAVRIENGTLFIDNWKVSDKDVLQYLYDNNCFEKSFFLEDIEIGSVENIELSLAELCNIGFYDSCKSFIAKNKYELRKETYYIYENDNSICFINQYNAITKFITSIKGISKHSFTDIDILNTVVSNDKQSVLITCDYTCEEIVRLNDKDLEKISKISTVLCEDNIEKKNLFINEIIDFLVSEHTNRFSLILENIGKLFDNCINAYSFYMSGFSSNKLKLEINTKAIEYTSKIQSVINEAQTKLIAIPSAFVLAALAMDFKEHRLLLNTRNIVTLISLFVFAILIQLFLSNQKSILKIIKADVEDFKDGFDKTKIELLSKKFECVDASLKKQHNRLSAITWILWIIPSLWCAFLIISQFV